MSPSTAEAAAVPDVGAMPPDNRPPVNVSVVVVNWNAQACLERCLRALQQQTEPAFEVIVIDNASTDGSPDLVPGLNDPRFRLVRLPANAGFARANNLAVAQASPAPWIALLNPDAFPAPDWLRQLLAAAHAQPQVAAWGCTLVNAADPSHLDGTGDSYHLGGRAHRRDHGRLRAAAHRGADEIFAPCAAAALYRRTAWMQAGGFDESYFCYLEDVDLGFRLRLLGWRCWHVPAAVCQHIGSATTGRRSDFSVYHGQRNLVWTYVKNMPGLLFWGLLPCHILTNLAALVLFACRGQGRVVWRAKRDAVRALPVAWAQRRELQAQRQTPLAAVWRVLSKCL